jgi:hypothetical protein
MRAITAITSSIEGTLHWSEQPLEAQERRT